MVRATNAQIVRWFGYLRRIDTFGIAKITLKRNYIKRWLADVRKDFKIMSVRG